MATFYAQKIYDNGLGAYVRYTTAIPTQTPNPADTSPVGVGPFNPTTHSIEAVFDDPYRDTLGGVDVQTPIGVVLGDSIEYDGAEFIPGGGGGGGGSYNTAFQWRPGGVANPALGIYDTWASLYAAVNAAPHTSRSVLIDGTSGSTTIPVGAWNLDGWTFSATEPFGSDLLEIADGATFDVATALADTTRPQGPLRLTFRSIYVDYLGTSGQFIDLTGYETQSLHIRVTDAEIDSYSGAAFLFLPENAYGAYIYVDGVFNGGLYGLSDGVVKFGHANSACRITMQSGFTDGPYVTGPGFLVLDIQGAAVYATKPTGFTGSYVRQNNAYTSVSAGNTFFSGNGSYDTWEQAVDALEGVASTRNVVHVYDGVTVLSPSSWVSTRLLGVPGKSTLNVADGAYIEIGTTSFPAVLGGGSILENIVLKTNETTAPTLVYTGNTTQTELVFRNCVIDASASTQPLVNAIQNSTLRIVFDSCTIILGTSELISATLVPSTLEIVLRNTRITSAGTITSAVGTTTTVTVVDAASAWVDQTGLLGTVTVNHYPKSTQKYTLAATTNAQVPADPLSGEVVVGGFAYEPGYDQEITFETMLAVPTATVTVRLYDMGTPGSWSAGTLRCTQTVSNTAGRTQTVLTPLLAPAVNSNEIATAEHLYEVRVVADTLETAYVHWSGLKVSG